MHIATAKLWLVWYCVQDFLGLLQTESVLHTECLPDDFVVFVFYEYIQVIKPNTKSKQAAPQLSFEFYLLFVPFDGMYPHIDADAIWQNMC